MEWCWKCSFSEAWQSLRHGKYIFIFRLVFLGCFRGLSQVFGVCFKVILWEFPEGFKCMRMIFQGCLRMFFFVKNGLLCMHTEAMAATHANSIGQKDPKYTPDTPIKHWRITLKHSRNNLPLKHPWNSLKIPMNRQKNTHVTINIYFHVTMMLI